MELLGVTEKLDMVMRVTEKIDTVIWHQAISTFISRMFKDLTINTGSMHEFLGNAADVEASPTETPCCF